MQPRFISTFCTWFWALQFPCSLSPRPRASPAIFLLPRLPGFPLHRETKQHQVRTPPGAQRSSYHWASLLTMSQRHCSCAGAGRAPSLSLSPHRDAWWCFSTRGWTRAQPSSQQMPQQNDSKLQRFALAKQFWTFIPELLLAVSYQVDKLTAEYMWKPRMFKTAYIFITHIDCPHLKKYVYMATIFGVRTVNKYQSSYQAQNQ